MVAQREEGSLISDFTITGVGDEERFSTDHGEFVSYQVEFEGSQGRGTATHKRKASSPEPQVGETMDAELVQKNGKTELKRVWKQNGSGGSRGSSSKPSDFRTPEQIMRGEAHGKAMHWCDVKIAAGEWKPLNWDQYITMVDAFYADVKAAS